MNDNRRNKRQPAEWPREADDLDEYDRDADDSQNDYDARDERDYKGEGWLSRNEP